MAAITGWCNSASASTAPFGVNPHFLSTSSLYQPATATESALSNASDLVRTQQGLPFGFVHPEVGTDS